MFIVFFHYYRIFVIVFIRGIEHGFTCKIFSVAIVREGNRQTERKRERENPREHIQNITRDITRESGIIITP